MAMLVKICLSSRISVYKFENACAHMYLPIRDKCVSCDGSLMG